MDPDWNERMAFRTPDSSTDMEANAQRSGIGQRLESNDEAGCFACSCRNVFLSTGAGLSSEHKIRITALIFPSSILAEITSETIDDESLRLLWCSALLVSVADLFGCGNDSMRFLTTEARLCFLPPIVSEHSTYGISAEKVAIQQCHVDC